MRRKAFTLVEIMIVVLIIGILLAIAVPQFITSRTTTQLTSCTENQQKLDDAKQMWIMDYEMGVLAAPDMPDLVPEYIKITPRCPTNAEYVLGNGNVATTCPDH